MVEPVPVVEVDEVPGERIRASLATYRWLFGDEGWREARTHAAAIGQAIAQVAPHWLDELSVWAAAAGTDLDDLLVLNARSELLSLIRADRRRGECTVVADPGLLGQTWDWYERQRQAMVVLRTGGLITVTEAGMLAKIGVNRHGLAVGLTFLASAADRVPGEGSLPVHGLLRLLLERSTDVAGALHLLEDVHLSGSACIPLVDPGAAAIVELTPGGQSVLPAGVHTNHCLDPKLLELQGPVPFVADSEQRLHRATALRAAGTPIADLLADTAGGCSAIDQPPDPALSEHDRTATVMGVVVEPQPQSLRIAPGRPSETGFTQLVQL